MSDEPATERQKVKLAFFNIPFPPTLTKSAAHELLDQIDDPEREKAYRAYRDELDEKQEAADDLNLRVDAWQSSIEMRDSDYRTVSDAAVEDVLRHLDVKSPGWERSEPMLFYEVLAQLHPGVLR